MTWGMILGAGLLWLAVMALLIKARQTKRIIAVLMLTVVVGSSSLYWVWGGWRQINAQASYDDMVKVLQSLYDSPKLTTEMVDDALDDIADKLPSHPFVWFKLGEIYERLAWYDKAKSSYQTAMKLAPNLETKIKFAYASALSQGGILDEATARVVESILAEDQQHMASLNLLAMDAFKKQNFLKAANIWQSMLKGQRGISSETIAIQKAIDKSIEQLKPEEIALLENKVRIKVKLQVDNELSKEISSGSVVYVFAKQHNRSGPPLAAVKFDARDLPEYVWLTANDAMVDGIALDIGQDIIITARIGQGGPFAQKGDIQGVSEAIHVEGIHKVNIKINERV